MSWLSSALDWYAAHSDKVNQTRRWLIEPRRIGPLVHARHTSHCQQDSEDIVVEIVDKWLI
jgi:hypothetical protein